MKGFLASDVLYERARDQILETLADKDVARGDPAETVFLPEPIDRWLDNIQVVSTLNVFASGTGSMASTASRCSARRSTRRR